MRLAGKKLDFSTAVGEETTAGGQEEESVFGEGFLTRIHMDDLDSASNFILI